MKSMTGPLALFAFTFLFCIVIVAIPSSCGGTNCADPKNALDAACVVENIVVECAGSDVSGVIAQYTPTVEDIISKGVQADGSITWSLIENDLISAVAHFGWCVVSSAFEEYSNSPAVGSGSAVPSATATAKPHPSPQAAKDAFNKLRIKLWPHASFHTGKGTL